MLCVVVVFSCSRFNEWLRINESEASKETHKFWQFHTTTLSPQQHQPIWTSDDELNWVGKYEKIHIISFALPYLPVHLAFYVRLPSISLSIDAPWQLDENSSENVQHKQLIRNMNITFHSTQKKRLRRLTSYSKNSFRSGLTLINSYKNSYFFFDALFSEVEWKKD